MSLCCILYHISMTIYNILTYKSKCLLPAAVWVSSASACQFYNPHTFQTAQKTWGEKKQAKISWHVGLYGSNRVSPTVSHGTSHGISDFHLHLLFWCSVSMAYHCDHATQLHPTQEKDASVIISNHFHMNVPQKNTQNTDGNGLFNEWNWNSEKRKWILCGKSESLTHMVPDVVGTMGMSSASVGIDQGMWNWGASSLITMFLWTENTRKPLTNPMEGNISCMPCGLKHFSLGREAKDTLDEMPVHQILKSHTLNFTCWVCMSVTPPHGH